MTYAIHDNQDGRLLCSGFATRQEADAINRANYSQGEFTHVRETSPDLRPETLKTCDDAGHRRDRHSPDGVTTIEECAACDLAWHFSPAFDRPVTLWRWMQLLRQRQAAQ